MGVIEHGYIYPGESWNPTEQIEQAPGQLVQLGVTIYSGSNGQDYTFMVPHRLFPEQYREIGKWMDVLAQQVQSDVYHVDWHPYGDKFRIEIPPMVHRVSGTDLES